MLKWLLKKYYHIIASSISYLLDITEAQLQEELQAMEIQEEKVSNYIQEQIDDYHSSTSISTLNNNGYCNNHTTLDNHNSNNDDDDDEMSEFQKSIVPCPLCHRGTLIKDATGTYEMIYCQRNRNTTFQYNNNDHNHHNYEQQRCKLCLNGIHGSNISLIELRGRLSQVYQEHSLTGCVGMLEFDVVEHSLVVGCHGCRARVTVV